MAGVPRPASRWPLAAEAWYGALCLAFTGMCAALLLPSLDGLGRFAAAAVGLLAGAAIGLGVGAGLRWLVRLAMDCDTDAAHGVFLGALSAICAGAFSLLVADALLIGLALTSAFGLLGFFVGYWKVVFISGGMDGADGSDAAP